MQVSDFKRIVSCFAETPANFDMSKGEFVVQLLDEVIAARFERREGSLFVVENGVAQTAESWIVRRVAKLPQLADRILTYVQEVPNFVNPSARVLPSMEISPLGADKFEKRAVEACDELLKTQIPGTTSVVYLTSDAGEGKTTLINVLARRVAEEYKRKERDWLLLPVPLGGRAFLRFDELVVSALVSRYRFQYWFFEGFIELVRMGVVVPAFDGFEEMIVEGSSGEAVSALGNLMNQLNSEGKVLFAARKAFFEYQSFRTQARLFDAIGREDSVAFSRISLERWTREQFEEYGHLRGRSDAPAIFDQVAARFHADHPLLTRAVLVRRLFDVAASIPEVQELLAELGDRPQDYFHQFVLAIIEREAREKWLDKEGREGQVLLTVQEHLGLLAAVAREMWLSTSDTLRQDVIDVVSDLFCEESNKSPVMARQVRERVKHHALLVNSSAGRGGLSFDHEDFRQFFIGVALGNLLTSGDKEGIRSFLRVAAVPDETAEEALLIFSRNGGSRLSLASKLLDVSAGESPTSFVIENVGNLVLRALNFESLEYPLEISNLSFGPHALRAKGLSNITFLECYFAPTGLYKSRLCNVLFRSCQFERLELSDESEIAASMENSDVACVVAIDEDETIFDPTSIRSRLSAFGFHYLDERLEELDKEREPDSEMLITERAIRSFMRATQHNEDTLRMKLGASATYFFDGILPLLLKAGVFEQTQYRGAGNQQRYRLAMHMKDLQAAISNAGGRFVDFLGEVQAQQKGSKGDGGN